MIRSRRLQKDNAKCPFAIHGGVRAAHPANSGFEGDSPIAVNKAVALAKQRQLRVRVGGTKSCPYSFATFGAKMSKGASE
jgi:hypothetical protein